MTLRDLIRVTGLIPADRQIDELFKDNKHKNLLDFELVAHEAGEQADEVVCATTVVEVKSIYLEYD